MVKWIVGGVITLVIGGTTYGISQSSVANNYAKNTGESQQQAQKYVNSIPQKDLESFSAIGKGYVSDGNSILNTASSLDCTNYTYQWVTSSLSCQDGQSQAQTAGNDEITLGNCYEALGTNLGNAASSKINECITDINTAVSDFNLPIISSIMSSSDITTNKNADAYNKSVLQAALQSN